MRTLTLVHYANTNRDIESVPSAGKRKLDSVPPSCNRIEYRVEYRIEYRIEYRVEYRIEYLADRPSPPCTRAVNDESPWSSCVGGHKCAAQHRSASPALAQCEPGLDPMRARPWPNASPALAQCEPGLGPMRARP